VLGVLVMLALGGSIWLFAAGDDDSDSGTSPTTPASETGDDDRSNGVLSLPADKGDGEDPTDSRRRGDEGRDRIDPDEAVEPSDDTGSGTDPDELPAVLARLEGRTIAIGAASSQTPGDPARKVKVGRIKVPCGGGTDAARTRVEVDLIDRIATVLERAGATVVRTDAPAACVDARAKRAQRADMAIIVRHGDADSARVLPGRATKTTAKATPPTPGSLRLADEIAVAAFKLKSSTPATTTADRRMLDRAGAFDLPGGGVVALVELPIRVAPIGDRDRLALAIATSMGVVAAGAGAGSVDATG
jgi:hypothetical protein